MSINTFRYAILHDFPLFIDIFPISVYFPKYPHISSILRDNRVRVPASPSSDRDTSILLKNSIILRGCGTRPPAWDSTGGREKKLVFSHTRYVPGVLDIFFLLFSSFFLLFFFFFSSFSFFFLLFSYPHASVVLSQNAKLESQIGLFYSNA